MLHLEGVGNDFLLFVMVKVPSSQIVLIALVYVDKDMCFLFVFSHLT